MINAKEAKEILVKSCKMERIDKWLEIINRGIIENCSKGISKYRTTINKDELTEPEVEHIIKILKDNGYSVSYNLIFCAGVENDHTLTIYVN